MVIIILVKIALFTSNAALLMVIIILVKIAFGIVGILDDIVLFLFLALYLSETVR